MCGFPKLGVIQMVDVGGRWLCQANLLFFLWSQGGKGSISPSSVIILANANHLLLKAQMERVPPFIYILQANHIKIHTQKFKAGPACGRVQQDSLRPLTL